MKWFGKKEKQTGGKHRDVTVTTIPDVFYGGENPVLYEAPVSAGRAAASAAPGTVQAGFQKPAPGGQPPKGGLAALLKTQKWWLIGILVFISAVAAISWYYVSRSGAGAAPAVPATARRAPEQSDTPPSTVSPPEPVREPEPEPAPAAPEVSAPTLIFPRIVLVDTADLDADELTDFEEELFSSDVGVWDSDGDGFYDGMELANLYDPARTSPARLIDSGSVLEYVSPQFNYRLYYPAAWQAADVDASGEQVLLSAITGDYIEVRAVPRETGQDFTAWFAQNAGRERITDLSPLNNSFGISGRLRKDNLVAYVNDSGPRVFVIIYHPSGSGPIRYRHIMNLLVQSFRYSEEAIAPAAVQTGESVL